MRLSAARAAGRLARRAVARQVVGWPALSPAAANASLLLVTTKPPSWRDPLLRWPEGPPTLGTAHDGFFYPDPVGFWAEVRRWVALLLGDDLPEPAHALAVSGLVQLAGGVGDLHRVLHVTKPVTILFLDEAAWEAAAHTLRLTDRSPRAIPDPYRNGVTYEGWWGATADGTVVGKSPQHPAAHRLYGADAMEAFLRSRPRPG